MRKEELEGSLLVEVDLYVLSGRGLEELDRVPGRVVQ
jgi:hypothetical protein